MHTRVPFLRLALAWLVAAATGCSGEPTPSAGGHATPRPDDPELTHSWQLPPDKSTLWSGDLGSKPPALADALMKDSVAPNVALRSANACAQRISQGGTASVALRLTIAEGGTVAALEGDPAGPAATCLADALRAELAKLAPLPAGAALLLLRFNTAAPR